MSQIAHKQIAEAQGKLVALLGEIRGTPEAERVTLWVAKMAAGKKLSEFIADASVDVKDKVTVLRSLVDILLAKAYERLPELPGAEIAPATVVTTARPQAEAPGDDEAPGDSSAFTPAQLAAIRREVRRQLAAVFGTMARVLPDSP